MRGTAGIVLTALTLIGLLRAIRFCAYVFIHFTIPTDSHFLESAMVHLAWRVQHGARLYPDWEAYPYVANFYSPLSFLITGLVGRILGADIRGLYLVGRGISVISIVATTLLIGHVLKRRYGVPAALFGMLLSLGGCPLFITGVMTRPDVLAEFLGLTGFFLADGRRRWTGATAALMLGLAAMTKQTALVYLLAATVGLYLEGRARRALVLFASVSSALLITVVIVQVWVEPNFVRCLLGESQTPLAFRAWWTTVSTVAIADPQFFVLVAAGAYLWSTGRKKEPGLTALALLTLTASLTTAAKRGSAPNYFLGVSSIAALAGGALWYEMTRPNSRPKTWQLLASLLVASGLLLSAYNAGAYVYLARRHAALFTRQRLDFFNLLYRTAENPKARLLTDSGAIDIHQGERTVFADPYRFKLMVEQGQIDPIRLREKIRTQYYELIITSQELFDDGYFQFDFGLPAPLVEEARLHYSPQAKSFGLFLYGRRPEPRAQ